MVRFKLTIYDEAYSPISMTDTYDKSLGGTIIDMTINEAEQLRDAINDAIAEAKERQTSDKPVLDI